MRVTGPQARAIAVQSLHSLPTSARHPGEDRGPKPAYPSPIKGAGSYVRKTPDYPPPRAFIASNFRLIASSARDPSLPPPCAAR